MPTPSNNPPPELPPRSYSSSCPDDVRALAQALRRHATPGDSDAMQVDNNDGAPTPPAPSSSSASASHGPIRTAPPPPSAPTVATMTDEDSEQESEEDELMGLLNDLSGQDESGQDESQPESLEEDAVRGLFHGLSRRPESRSGVGTAQTSPQSAGPDDEYNHENDAAAREASSKALETTGAGSGSCDRNTTPALEAHMDIPDELASLMAEDSESRRMFQSFELPPMGYETTNMRVRSTSTTDTRCDTRLFSELTIPAAGLQIIPTLSSSFLRPGSRFKGTQQSERQIYDVEVEIKNVDLRESFLCGYLRIQGQSALQPSLTPMPSSPFYRGPGTIVAELDGGY